MNAAALLDFLHDLAQHNEREWFQDQKPRYDPLRADFLADVAYWLRELAATDPALADLDPAKCVFRIYRDVRFSKNKDPYKAHFSAYFAPGGKHGTAPGYYLKLAPGGESLVAGGLHEPGKEQLAAVRQELDYQPETLEALLAAPATRRLFPAGLAGEQLKKMPPGYAPDHPHASWLRHKSLLLSHPLPDAALRRSTPATLRARVLEALRGLVPFNEWLTAAAVPG